MGVEDCATGLTDAVIMSPHAPGHKCRSGAHDTGPHLRLGRRIIAQASSVQPALPEASWKPALRSPSATEIRRSAPNFIAATLSL
jgi:hypothetical protein